MKGFLFLQVFYAYVLYSPSFDKIYIGYTSNLENRLNGHNHLDKKGWTRKFRPWVILFFEEFEYKKQALTREKQLKSYRGRCFIREQIQLKYK